MRTKPKAIPWWCVLPVLLVATIAVALSFGGVALTPIDFWRDVMQGDARTLFILWQVRWPRLLAAMLVGASLGVSGAVFQGVLRNPLADPYLLGLSGGAGVGAVTALAFGGGMVLASVAGFGGALLALSLVYLAAGAQRGTTHTLILAGVMVGSLASAFILLLLWSAPDASLRSAFFWLAGSFAEARSDWLPGLALWSLVAFVVLLRLAPELNLLSLGEETATDLGVPVAGVRLLLMVSAGALTAASVALAGLVGFVGLVVPHIARMIWGPDHRQLLPASALSGAIFVLLADTLARVVMFPSELPVGVLTALIGAPMFLSLLRQRGGGR